MPLTEQIVAGELPPPMFEIGDTPRVRRSDPITSHEAADRSARGLSALRMAVLRLVWWHDRLEGLTGSEINELYLHRATSVAFPRAHPDSPRKRAGELAERGLLDVVDHRVGEFGSREAAYRVSPEGRALLAEVSS